MKLFVSPRKLLSKFNLVDVILILIVLTLIPVLKYSYNISEFYTSMQADDSSLAVGLLDTKEYIVSFNKLDKKTTTLIKPGHKHRHSLNAVPLAEIIKILTISKVANSDLYNVYATVKFHGIKKSPAFYYQRQLLVPKTSITFSTNDYTLRGGVRSEVPTHLPRTGFSIAVRVVFKNISPDLLLQIKEGDAEYIHTGEAIAELIKINRIYTTSFSPRSVYTITSSHKKTARSKNRHKIIKNLDAWFILRGSLRQDNTRDSFIFKNKELRQRSPMRFSPFEYTADGSVTALQELAPTSEPLSKTPSSKEFHALFSNIDKKTLYKIKVGHQEVDKKENTTLKIKEIYNFTKNLEQNTFNLSTRIALHGYKHLQLDANNFFRNKYLVEAGASISLNHHEYNITGKLLAPINPDLPDNNSTYVLCKIIFSYSPDHVVKKVKKGDIQINDEGQIMAQVIRAKKIDEKKHYIPDLRVRLNPKESTYITLKKQSTFSIQQTEAWVLLRASVGAHRFPDNKNYSVLMFNGSPILVNSSVEIKTRNYNIAGVIQKIELYNENNKSKFTF